MAAKCQHDAIKSTPFLMKHGILLKVSGDYTLRIRPL
jgi:hypothetical protein